MSLRTKGLVLAMEEEGLEIEPTDSEEVSQTVAEVIEGADEVEENHDEIEELDEAVDDAQGDAETLEKIQDVMEESVEKGEGLDETSAEIAEIAIESICARLGIQKRVMPAMESFGSSNSRVVATKIALEGIKETLANIWKAIASAFQSMMNSIKAFFQKYLTALGQSKEALAKLDSAVKAFDKTEKSSEEITNAGLAKVFAIGNKADLGTVSTLIKNHIDFNSQLLASGNAVKEVIKEAKGDVFAIDPEKLYTTSDDYIKAFKSEADLVDGVTINAVKEEGEGGIKGFVAKLKIGKKDASASTLPVLSKEEMGKLVGELKILLGSAEKYDKTVSEFEHVNQSIINLAKSMQKSVEKLGKSEDVEENKKVQENSKAASASINNLKSIFKTTLTTVPNLNVKALKAGILYVNASMKAYK